MTSKRTFRIVLGLVVLCLLSLSVVVYLHRALTPVQAKLLAVNDFHGQLQPQGKRDRAGGAAFLVGGLKAAQKGMEGKTVIVLAGDTVGASPADSALLHDEPAIMVFNSLANAACLDDKKDPRCNMVSTLGNHEFDKGQAELARQINGGNAPDGPFLENPWRGAAYPYVCANVVSAASGKTILPPYAIKKIGNIPVAFIGAVVKGTPNASLPANVAGLKFLDEAEAINSYVPALRAKGIRAIVAVIHQGGNQEEYAGPTDTAKPSVEGPIVSITRRLDPEVDIVISGHTHKFTNAYVKNAGGRDVLVTQAWVKGTAFADIDMVLDPTSGDIIQKSAKIVPVNAQTPSDAGVETLVTQADTRVAPLVNRSVGQAKVAITREENPAGESGLGDLVADAFRRATGTDFAFMNPGGIRNDLPQGPITWGSLFACLPFGNDLVTMQLTGDQLYAVLAQQWSRPAMPRMLQISGLNYVWTEHGQGKPGTIDAIYRNDGTPIDRTARYSVTVNSFLAAGGDAFTVFAAGTDSVERETTEVEALRLAIEAQPSPVPPVLDRITRKQSK